MQHQFPEARPSRKHDLSTLIGDRPKTKRSDRKRSATAKAETRGRKQVRAAKYREYDLVGV